MQAQAGRVDLEHGYVGGIVLAENLGGPARAGPERDRDLRGPLHDVSRRKDPSVVVDHEAAASAVPSASGEGPNGLTELSEEIRGR
jgi:hypothetical protein